jgi:hypothetical protein
MGTIRALKFNILSPSTSQSVGHKEQAILVSWHIFASQNSRVDQIYPVFLPSVRKVFLLEFGLWLVFRAREIGRETRRRAKGLDGASKEGENLAISVAN